MNHLLKYRDIFHRRQHTRKCRRTDVFVGEAAHLLLDHRFYEAQKTARAKRAENAVITYCRQSKFAQTFMISDFNREKQAELNADFLWPSIAPLSCALAPSISVSPARRMRHLIYSASDLSLLSTRGTWCRLFNWSI